MASLQLDTIMRAICAAQPGGDANYATWLASDERANYEALVGDGDDPVGALLKGNNLSDLEDVATALVNLGIVLPQPGDIKMGGWSAAPTGWIFCDGASLLRAGAYAPLFAAIGTAYGTADGTHFNVPDFRGRAPYGLGTHVDVNGLGDSDGAAVADRTPNHLHDEGTLAGTAAADAVNVVDILSAGAESISQADHTHAVTVTGDTGLANTGYLVCNFVIKT